MRLFHLFMPNSVYPINELYKVSSFLKTLKNFIRHRTIHKNNLWLQFIKHSNKTFSKISLCLCCINLAISPNRNNAVFVDALKGNFFSKETEASGISVG